MSTETHGSDSLEYVGHIMFRGGPLDGRLGDDTGPSMCFYTGTDGIRHAYFRHGRRFGFGMWIFKYDGTRPREQR